MNIITLLYICGIIGMLDTLYLIYHKVSKTPVWCPFFPDEWCHKVQHSPQSKTMGIPNVFLGFVMYIALLVFTWLYATDVWPALPIQVLVWAGFVFSIYFLYVQAFVLRAFCTWCLVSALNFIILFIAIWFL